MSDEEKDDLVVKGPEEDDQPFEVIVEIPEPVYWLAVEALNVMIAKHIHIDPKQRGLAPPHDVSDLCLKLFLKWVALHAVNVGEPDGPT